MEWSLRYVLVGYFVVIFNQWQVTKQTRTNSFIESMTNVAIGYGVALASQLLVFPVYGIRIPLSDNVAIGLWFTVISIIRSYVIRRWFTRRTEHD